MVAADTVKSNVQETAADTTPEPAEQEHPSIIKLLALTVIGLVVILVSSDYAVDAAVALAKVFDISDRVIGLTIVALGTSLPELVTSVTAALRGNADLAVGNVVGSCIRSRRGNGLAADFRLHPDEDRTLGRMDADRVLSRLRIFCTGMIRIYITNLYFSGSLPVTAKRPS